MRKRRRNAGRYFSILYIRGANVAGVSTAERRESDSLKVADSGILFGGANTYAGLRRLSEFSFHFRSNLSPGMRVERRGLLANLKIFDLQFDYLTEKPNKRQKLSTRGAASILEVGQNKFPPFADSLGSLPVSCRRGPRVGVNFADAFLCLASSLSPLSSVRDHVRRLALNSN